MRSLGQNIKQLRQEAGLHTQKALADLLGVAGPQVSDWENDRYAFLTVSTLVKIAKGLRCSVDRLLAGVCPEYDRAREDGGAHEIPLIAEGVAFPEAGHDRARYPADLIQWISRPRDLRDPGAYAVRIRGSSMLPAYWPTTIAFVSPSCRVQDGDEVYVQLVSGQCLVRMAHAFPRGFMFQPYNHAYTACFVEPSQIRTMHVILYSRRRE